jgi:hypothetical protein
LKRLFLKGAPRIDDRQRGSLRTVLAIWEYGLQGETRMASTERTRGGGAASTVIERVKVREVAGVFRAQDSLDAAVKALLAAGFDRGDIDVMARVETVRERLGGAYVAVEALPEVSATPRRAFIAREEISSPLALVAALIAYIGATAALLGVVASGGSVALAAVAAAAGGAGAGSLGAVIARTIGRDQGKQLEAELEAGGIVLWVRARTPEREEQAQQILREHGGEAVRVHEIDIEKRLEDLPLSSWLNDELIAGS